MVSVTNLKMTSLLLVSTIFFSTHAVKNSYEDMPQQHQQAQTLVSRSDYNGINPSYFFTMNQTEYDLCYDFLTSNMPERDISNVLDPILNETITYALYTRNTLNYASPSIIPFNIFLNNVLPYAHLSEARDNWRRFFFTQLSNYTSYWNENDYTITNITLFIINNLEKLFNNLHFESDQTPLIMSPFEVYSWGYASCTGFSIFTCSVLRSIGIPCRVAGVPQWNSECTGMAGNHDWIEIFTEDGYWSFSDATGTNVQGFNQTWFFPKDTNCQIEGSLNMSIYATAWEFDQNSTYFVMAWDYDGKYVPGIDRTSYYQNAASRL